MNKWSLISVFTALFAACQPTHQDFVSIPCNSNPVGSENKRIFTSCRQFLYKASYWDDEYNLISDDKVRMTVTGADSYNEGQDELVIQFAYNPEEEQWIKSHGINTGLKSREWTHQVSEGFAEGEKGVWIHPIRHNQYVFTEVAPLPMITYSKLWVGNEWNAELNIYDGWGDWENANLKEVYQVIDVGELETPFRKLDSCWHIQATSFASFGTSTNDYWFHRDYGFVRMQYKNYVGQLLIFDLLDVTEVN